FGSPRARAASSDGQLLVGAGFGGWVALAGTFFGTTTARAWCLLPEPTVPAMTTKSLVARFVTADFWPFLRTRVLPSAVHCQTVPSRLRMVSVLPLLPVS